MEESNNHSNLSNVEVEKTKKNVEVEKTKKNVEVEKTKKKQDTLRYLDFVHVAAIQAMVCISRVYDFAKENSGPLKSGVQTVEGTVKAVVGPVYEKFHDVSFGVLKFVDHKVGDAVEEVHRHVPSLVKEASTQTYNIARTISDEVHRSGVISTAAIVAKSACSKAEPAARSLYTKYEPVAEHYAMSAWKSLNKLPVFPQAAQIVVPTAAHWTEKYNRAVAYSAEKGYGFASYLPIVPVEKIAKVFREKEDGKPAAAATAK